MVVEAHIIAAGLSEDEKARLAEYERTIRSSMETFVKVGEAIAEIRNRKLYRETHGTFEDYCRDTFGFTSGRARQLTTAANVAKEIKSVTGVTLPNEKTARTVAQIPSKDRADVVEAAAKDGPVTTARIAGEVAKRKGPPPERVEIEAEPLIDKAGREYRDPEVMKALGQTGEFDSIVNDLNALRRRVEALGERAVGKEIRTQQIATDFKNISTAVRFAKPHTTCPYMPNCEDGCNTCGGARWVTKEQWDRIPEEDRS